MAPATASNSGNTTSVQVAVRIRPTTSHDLSAIPARFQRVVIHSTNATTVTVDNLATPGATPGAGASSSSSSTKRSLFAFDQVLAPEASQYDLYTSTAAPLVSRFVEGFNCTILAYGQTSSGKTYSMTGVDLDADPTDPNNGMGIIPRAVSTIFARANELKRERGNGWVWSIKASFIEIYNEDLIDLLAVDDTAAGARRDVQIREEKDGTIIWTGLREIPVRSAADVMAILTRGTAHRRTNETDMNAQSSRSHAIFSVTLTQKKYTGSGPAPRIAAPTQNGSPSKIARPGSMYGGSTANSRVSSPTFGRPQSSFGMAMGRGSNTTGALRPASSLGHRTDTPEVEENVGEWSTVVSKFHFVDLAGSERLKRTAAAGERIKEGISINGGLLALGNVISALGDPSRARSLGHGTAIHVPYRDSKLTRLLQDSLGGNAHTLMIACVSPSEWNHAETVNTLKYANRARNIRNRAEIREKEDGWDDVEWLQTMVTKLRKDVKAMKDGRSTPPSSVTGTTVDGIEDAPGASPRTSAAVADRAGGKVLKQYAELQAQYRNLRTEYVERNDELARMRKELEEKSAPLTGARRYEEIVGPVIEEYEKTISAMEAELKLQRTALEHTNEMYTEQENEIAVYKERTTNADGYIEALRSRITKLAEREASTESYVRDLEIKLKSYQDNAASEDTVAELRKEITRYKEAEGASGTYIASLEQRLTRADTDIVALRAHVESLEASMERKNTNLATLQARLDSLLREGEDLRGWKDDLAEREKRVQDLERKMEEWDKVRLETGLERQRLSTVVSDVESSRLSLEAEVNSSHASSSPTYRNSSITIVPGAKNPEDPTELVALREKHQSTLEELEEVSSKYRDALKEISDLAAQISEAKLHSETSSEVSSESGAARPTPRSSPGRQRAARTIDGLSNLSIPSVPVKFSAPPPARRNFFRHAASSEGLHSRSQSQSLSSEFSSTSFSRTSWAPGDSLLSPTSATGRHIRRQTSQDISRSPESLEKEIQSLQAVLKDRESEIGELEQRLAETSPNYFPAAPTPSPRRTLPEVKEESGLPSPPDTIIGSDLSPGISSQLNNLKMSILVDEHQIEAERKEAESISRLDELMRSMALKESQHVAVVDRLNDELEALRRQHEDLATSSREQASHVSMQSQSMSGEIESLRAELATVGKQYADAITNREQLYAQETELLEAQSEAEQRHKAIMLELHRQHDDELKAREEAAEEMTRRHSVELAALASSQLDNERGYDAKLRALDKQHNSSIDLIVDSHANEMAQLKADHTTELTRVSDQGAHVAQKAAEEHTAAVTKLVKEHQATLADHNGASEAAISRLREDHAAELRRIDMAREGTLTESQERQAAIIEELHGEHRSNLQRKEAEFATDLEKARTDYERQLSEMLDVHAVALNKLLSESAKQQSELAETLEEARADHATAIQAREEEHGAHLDALQDEHNNSTAELEAIHAAEAKRLAGIVEEASTSHRSALAELISAHETTLAESTNKYLGEVDGLKAEHTIAAQKLKNEHRQALSEAQETLDANRETHRKALLQLHEEHQAQLENAGLEKKTAIEELSSIHTQELDTRRKAHELSQQEVLGLKAAVAQLESEAGRHHTEHQTALDTKDDKITTLETELSGVKEERISLGDIIKELQAELERTRHAHEDFVHEASKRQSVVSELEHHRSLLDDTQIELQRVRDEMDALREEKSRQDTMIAEMHGQVAPAAKQRSNLPPAKLPPLTPPPSIPPPPIPGSVPPVPSLPNGSSVSSATRSSTGSYEDTHSGRSTPSTSLAHTSTSDPKLQQQILEQQNRHTEEQEAMIKTLNKQLTHCESDLQAHMDLVATLETSLTDSERNLRKTRMQANEFSKERDRLNLEVDTLRNQIQLSQQEISEVRRSVAEEKQSFELRLEEERRAKERTRTQLESRMDEISKRKSKFVCL